MTYLPIENYGVIGDLHTVALVGTNGSIDWFCFPHFDSPSLFGAILDDRKGGRFQISPAAAGVRSKQFYWPGTNVLMTRFLSPDGVGELVDYMPVEPRHMPMEPRPHALGHHTLVRRVSVPRGSMSFHLTCTPAFDYARAKHSVDVEVRGACFRTTALEIGLASAVPLQVQGPGVEARFTLHEGQSVHFILHQIEPGAPCCAGPSEAEADRLFRGTVDFWRRWLSQCTYQGRWREMVERSALVLKLLTFQPTGAIVAAPTCSLPEDAGGERNWDYRYTWIRDAAFTLYGLLRIGFTDEAGHFMSWLVQRIAELNPDGSLQIMYGIDGRHELAEATLEHLEGYRGSRPVRVGNGAASQLQLDIYGELMDSVYLYNKYGNPISYDQWSHLRRMLDWVCEHWQQKDEGIWESRAGRQHFVYSKLMCWVALDRGLRLAEKRSFPADRGRWLEVRDRIYEEILRRGWSEERAAFVQHYDSRSLDAANLIMPLVFFMSPTDPRMLSTVDATLAPAAKGGLVSAGLVYRYNLREGGDGLKGEEGTFNICTFWLVEALTRAGRSDPARLERARLIFEKMLGYANHVGLYAEETGASGEALGNFPQAFTHLALISAAYNLDRALGQPH